MLRTHHFLIILLYLLLLMRLRLGNIYPICVELLYYLYSRNTILLVCYRTFLPNSALNVTVVA